MDQPALFHESLHDALRDCVRALGEPKAVGHAMRPEKSMDEARTWLLNCLNPDRPEKFDPEQILWILREARKVGCHAAFAYMARECGYADPVPIEPEDERAALQREFIETGKALKSLLARMDRAGLRAA
jgi:hypothetical protein